MDAATSKSILFFVISEIILNFATEFIHHSKEGNRRTLGQDALRPLLFYIIMASPPYRRVSHLR